MLLLKIVVRLSSMKQVVVPPQGSPVFAIKCWVMQRTEVIAVNLESHHLMAGVVVALSILEDVVLLVTVEAEVHMMVLALLLLRLVRLMFMIYKID